MEDFYRLELFGGLPAELRSRAERRIGANRRSKRSKIVSPSMIGSHGSSRRFLRGFGTRRPIGGVTWIGWASAWDTAAWMTGMRLPSTTSCGTGAGRLMKHYRGSPALAVIGLIPGRNWCEWKFRRVPPGSGKWRRTGIATCAGWGRNWGFAGRKTGIGFRPSDIVRPARKRVAGEVLFALRPHAQVPAPTRLGSARQAPADPSEEVLAWADAHHARHGTWPTCVRARSPGPARHGAG